MSSNEDTTEARRRAISLMKKHGQKATRIRDAWPDATEFDDIRDEVWMTLGELTKAFQAAIQHGRESAADPAEICICAAIRLPDGRVIRGHRHGDCIRTAKELIDYRFSQGWEATDYEGMRADMDPASQGFVTSRNRYVDRKEGLRLQLAAGIESAAPGGYRGQLFSEDLYGSEPPTTNEGDTECQTRT